MEGKWVTTGCDAPVICGSFPAETACSGQISICGLGFFELYLNGERVSDELFVPAWTNYSSREGQRLTYPLKDRMQTRVLYRTYQVSLTAGKNEIRVLLGNGWYNQRDRRAEGEMWYGDAPCLIFDLSWTEGGKEKHYRSGEELKWYPSFITCNNIYFGETHDLRKKETEEKNRKPVSLCKGPDGVLQEQTCPADRIIRRLTPVQIGEKDGRRIFDAGENITGWLAFINCSKRGEKTEIRYAEVLDNEGKLHFFSAGKNQIQTNTYISDGKEALCHPRFTWHGFRYFDVRGEIRDPIVCVIHSDIPVTGSFRCSHPTLNWIADSYIRSKLGNMHCGVPSDCPHRERLGYTGDGQNTAMTDMYLFGADSFYRKWIRDIYDCQNPDNGHVQHTAPFYGGGGGPAGWGGAIVLVPWAHYCRYQDRTVLAEGWPHMVKWTDYMQSRMENGAIVREEKDGWCLGDWCPPEPVALPEVFVNTSIFARCLRVMEEAAGILGEDASQIHALYENTLQTICDNWYDGSHFCKGIQGADALAMEAGIELPGLSEHFALHYRTQPWFDTGFLASGSLIRELFRQGYEKEAVDLLTSEEPEHSFGWQMAQGADTLWERWNGYESRNHPMFGCVLESFFGYLGGIDLKNPKILHPVFPEKLDWVSCRAETAEGQVCVSWKRTENGIELEAETAIDSILRIHQKYNEKEPVKDYPLHAGMNHMILPIHQEN